MKESTKFYEKTNEDFGKTLVEQNKIFQESLKSLVPNQDDTKILDNLSRNVAKIQEGAYNAPSVGQEIVDDLVKGIAAQSAVTQGIAAQQFLQQAPKQQNQQIPAPPLR